jgi:hypothetical protein
MTALLGDAPDHARGVVQELPSGRAARLSVERAANRLAHSCDMSDATCIDVSKPVHRVRDRVTNRTLHCSAAFAHVGPTGATGCANADVPMMSLLEVSVLATPRRAARCAGDVHVSGECCDTHLGDPESGQRPDDGDVETVDLIGGDSRARNLETRRGRTCQRRPGTQPPTTIDAQKAAQSPATDIDSCMTTRRMRSASSSVPVAPAAEFAQTSRQLTSWTCTGHAATRTSTTDPRPR